MNTQIQKGFELIDVNRNGLPESWQVAITTEDAPTIEALEVITSGMTSKDELEKVIIHTGDGTHIIFHEQMGHDFGINPEWLLGIGETEQEAIKDMNEQRRKIMNILSQNKDCEFCEGLGWVENGNSCHVCHGQGQLIVLHHEEISAAVISLVVEALEVQSIENVNLLWQNQGTVYHGGDPGYDMMECYSFEGKSVTVTYYNNDPEPRLGSVEARS